VNAEPVKKRKTRRGTRGRRDRFEKRTCRRCSVEFRLKHEAHLLCVACHRAPVVELEPEIAASALALVARFDPRHATVAGAVAEALVIALERSERDRARREQRAAERGPV
jgi:hypothetical protein